MSKPNCEWKTSQFENFNTEWESFKQSDMLLESTHMQWLPINILALQCQQHCLCKYAQYGIKKTWSFRTFMTIM